MERHVDLIGRYKNKISPVKRILSALEVVSFFTTTMDTEIISLQQVYNPYLAYNFENAYVNQDKIPVEAGRWYAYRVFKNKQSELYYRESRVQNEGFVWFICEEKTGYFTSNSQLLFLEMELKQGLSREDYENETMDFFNYLERYDAYLRQKLLLQNIE